jgi:hypothetical protein
VEEWREHEDLDQTREPMVLEVDDISYGLFVVGVLVEPVRGASDVSKRTAHSQHEDTPRGTVRAIEPVFKTRLFRWMFRVRCACTS